MNFPATRHAAPAILRLWLTGIAVALVSCSSPKNDGLERLGLAKGVVTRISVTDRNRNTLDLLDSTDIRLVLARCATAEPGDPESTRAIFVLTFFKEYDEKAQAWPVVSLVMGKRWIGKMMEDPAASSRWSFPDDSLALYFGRRLRTPR